MFIILIYYLELLFLGKAQETCLEHKLYRNPA